MADPSATTDIASSYTFLGNNLTDMMLPINVTADLQSEVILGENNQTKIPNVLILTTSMKGMIMFYNTIVIVIGVFGNIGVLYLSMKHRALKMDKVTLVFIENLALADIIISLLFYMPMLATVPSGMWVFGGATCWFTGFFSSHVPFLAQILLIMSISVYRLWVVKKPSEVRKRIDVRHFKVTILFIWLIAFVPVIFWIASKAEAFFFTRGLICWSTNHVPSSPTYLSTKIFSAFYVAIPMVIVFITSVKIMYTIVLHTLKAGRSLVPHLRTLLTVNLICWTLLVSYFPLFVLIILKSTNVPIPNWFTLFQIYAKSIQVVVNPFIYVATNLRFRRCVTRFFVMERHTLIPDTPVSPSYQEVDNHEMTGGVIS